MKKMSLQEIQSVSLDIMKHIHAFCKENDIKYSLGYGSLIGAVRHKGFIPWDDDVDIVMMREDFDRFCLIYQDTPEFKLFSFSRGNMYATCARVCDMKRTLVKTVSPLFTEPTGLWIDIFPLDSVDDDPCVFESKKNEVLNIHKQIIQTRSLKRCLRLRDIYHCKSFIRRVKSLLVKREEINLWELVRCQDSLCRSFAPSDSKMMSMLVFPTYIDREYSPKHVFSEVFDVPFEDTNFSIMKGYDEWLTIIYGDYMTPPSDNKAKKGHSFHKYYWR